MNKENLKAIEKALMNAVELKGISIEPSGELDTGYFRLEDEVRKGNISIYIESGYLDGYLLLNLLSELIESGEITITLNENAKEDNVDYINRLGRGILK